MGQWWCVMSHRALRCTYQGRLSTPVPLAVALDYRCRPSIDPAPRIPLTVGSMYPRFVLFGCFAASLAAGVAACSRAADSRDGASTPRSDSSTSASQTMVASNGALLQALTPNEFGRIPVFEYHLIVDKNGLYERTHDGLRRDLETMYARGYRPISVAEMVDRQIDLPAGQSPVVLVFD